MTGPAACPRKLFEALETAENKNPKDSLQARCVADSATAVVKSHVFGALFFLGPVRRSHNSKASFIASCTDGGRLPAASSFRTCSSNWAINAIACLVEVETNDLDQ